MKYLPMLALILGFGQASMAVIEMGGPAPKRMAAASVSARDLQGWVDAVRRQIDIVYQYRQIKYKTEHPPRLPDNEYKAINGNYDAFIQKMQEKARREPPMSNEMISNWRRMYIELYLDSTARKEGASVFFDVEKQDRQNAFQQLLELDLHQIQNQLALLKNKRRLDLSFFGTIQLLVELNGSSYKSKVEKYIALIHRYMGRSLYYKDSLYTGKVIKEAQFVHDLLQELKRLREIEAFSNKDIADFLEMMTHVADLTPLERLGVFRYFTRPSFNGSTEDLKRFNHEEGLSFVRQLMTHQNVDVNLLRRNNIIHINKMRVVLSVVAGIGDAHQNRDSVFARLREPRYENLLKAHYMSLERSILQVFFRTQRKDIFMSVEHMLDFITKLVKELEIHSMRGTFEEEIVYHVVMGLRNKSRGTHDEYISRFVRQRQIDAPYFEEVRRQMSEQGVSQAEIEDVIFEDTVERTKQIMQIPLNTPIPSLFDNGIDIHVRDPKTAKAVTIFINRMRVAPPAPDNEMPKSITDFLQQVMNNQEISQSRRELFEYALRTPKKADEAYGPLMDTALFSIAGFQLSGVEFADLIWKFICSLPDQKERALASEALVSALVDCYEQNQRVCNPGKVQRILVAVVQGRMPEVKIDEIGPSTKELTTAAMNEFFTNLEHQKIEEWEVLKQAVLKFINDRPAIKGSDVEAAFKCKIRKYAILNGILEEPTSVQQPAAAE